MLLEEFVYLFLVDPVMLPYEKEFPDFQYPAYEEREPGYGQSWLKAYNYAFKAPKDGKITLSLLLGINQQAMAFGGPNSGQTYRNQSGNFSIGPSTFNNNRIAYAPNFSGSTAGLIEFIEYWFKNTPINKHTLSFSNDSKNQHFAITAYDQDKIKWVSAPLNDIKFFRFEWLNLTDVTKRADELFHDTNYECTIDIMSGCEDALIPDEVEIELKHIIAGFDEEISLPVSDKITVIAKYIQRINQLHPFLDGNIRTCSILLNKLLRDYDLPLCILLNPNRLDASSVSELVALIKQGQLNYQRLLQNQKDTFVFDSESEDKSARRIVAKSTPLINIDEETIQTFLKGLETEALPSVAANTHGLFAPPLDHKELLLKQLRQLIGGKAQYQNIIQAVEEDKFGVALRKACCAGTPPIIKTIFKFQKVLAIDLHERSSNGKAAWDWLQDNTAIVGEEKESLLFYLQNNCPTDTSFALK